MAVTGWGQAADRRRTADAGFDHHFVKPLSAAALAEALCFVASAPGRTDERTSPAAGSDQAGAAPDADTPADVVLVDDVLDAQSDTGQAARHRPHKP